MEEIRLQAIATINPEWHSEIVSFLEDNPEFGVLIPYVSFTKYPCGFNKNPGEPYDPDSPRNIFETLLYSIAAAGVNMSYAYKQYKQIIHYLRETDYLEEDMEFPFKIQPKKVQIYKDLINILLQKDINISHMTLEDLELVKQVKGIGITTLALCQTLYGDGHLIPYSDKNFISGFGKLYGIDKPTKKQMIETTNKWKNKRVGNMFIYQCYHYY